MDRNFLTQEHTLPPIFIPGTARSQSSVNSHLIWYTLQDGYTAIDYAERNPEQRERLIPILKPWVRVDLLGYLAFCILCKLLLLLGLKPLPL